MAVNFEYYKVFYYVAKYQSLSLAAQMLHLTHPRSAIISRRWSRTGRQKLFIRSKRGVTSRRKPPLCCTTWRRRWNISKAEDNLENFKSMDTGSYPHCCHRVGFLTGIVPVIKGISPRLSRHLL